MAGGMLTKQAILLTAKYLNTVNDAVAGGQIFSLPSGVQSPPYSQTLPGDRIVLDDVSAAALSDTIGTGTLYGGVYMYVGTLSTSTASPARGALAFWPTANLPAAGSPSYICSADVQPNTLLPAYIAGVFINQSTLTPTQTGVPLVKGNYGWIQVAGVASCLFDSTLTSTALAATVSAKVSASVASSVDAGVALTTVTLANVLGVAVGTPVISTISSVIITRGGTFCGRI
jgi:hypothetical protein